MTPLDMYDEYPKDMLAYLRNYGWNFNKKACEFAIKKIKRENFTPVTKDKVQEILQKENIILKNDQLYNSVYVTNIAKAMYFGSSLTSDQQVAKYIKDTIENVDSDVHFVQWYANMCHSGNTIPWEDFL